MGDPAQVLDVLRDVLTQHMKAGVPEFQIRRAIFIGRNSGRLIGEDQILSGSDVPCGLRLTMESGDEYDLILTPFAENVEGGNSGSSDE